MKCIQGSKRRQVRCYVKGGEAISKTAAIVNRAYSAQLQEICSGPDQKTIAAQWFDAPQPPQKQHVRDVRSERGQSEAA